MLKLHNLTSLVKKRKRIGRGGSRGGTSTKGHKGQRARTSGNVRPGYEGGQMPLFRRLPKRGFTNIFKRETVVVNLQQINDFFDAGAHIDRDALLEKGLIDVKQGIQGKRTFIKILGTGTLTKKFTILADAFSKSAQKSIEDQGGEAQLTKEI